MIERGLVLRGVAAGGLAGLLAFAFSRIMLEPVIQTSIDYESARERVAAGLGPVAAGPDIFSRGVQRSVGAPVGLLAFGMAMGALAAVIFVLAHRRYRDRLTPRALALAVAAAAFIGIYMIPFLKYPSNPPAIGHSFTVHARGNLYLGMVAASVASLIAAFWLARSLAARFGGWNGAIATALIFIGWMAIVMGIFPALGHLHLNELNYGNVATETPLPLKNPEGQIVFPGFPADVLFKFRLYTVINQLIVWGTIGLAFGYLAERALVPAAGRSARRLPAFPRAA